MNKDSLNKLKKYCLDCEIKITDKQINCFDLYGDFLKDYNNKVNLTSIVDDDEIVKKHFLDSLIVGKYLDLNNKKIIDVGSGAGFPGAPIKIMNDSVNMTLMDSIGKKTKFLELLKEHLKIDLIILNKRAEDLGRDKKYREQYDISLARAVKNLRVLSEYCLPLVKLGGYFVAMKGSQDNKQELDEARDIIKTLGGEIKDIIDYKLAFEDERKLILIKKISQTPPRYPRLTAQILKKK